MCKYKVYFDKKIKKDFKKLDKNVLKLLLDWIENNLETVITVSIFIGKGDLNGSKSC